MSPFKRHLTAAEGFLELGLPGEALRELDWIEPEMRHASEVLLIRLNIYRRWGKWALAEAAARVLYRRNRSNTGHIFRLAEAVWHSRGHEASIQLLNEAIVRRRGCSMLVYQLAIYEALDGRVAAARQHLADAIELLPGYREFAQEDERLRPLLEDWSLP